MDFSKFHLLFNLIVTAECITFFAAILLLHKKEIGRWRLFIPMLFIIVSVETLGWYFRYYLSRPNPWIFNLNMIVTDVFILWMLSTGIKSAGIRKITISLVSLFVLFAVGNLLFIQGIQQYNQYTESVGDVIEVIICCVVLFHFAREDVYHNLLSNEYFWLTNGVLFSAIGGAFLYTFPTILANFQKHTGIGIFGILNNILNILLYGSMITAFICRNRNMKSLQVL